MLSNESELTVDTLLPLETSFLSRFTAKLHVKIYAALYL